MAKAKLEIYIDETSFQVTEIDLFEPTIYENQLPELVAHRLEVRCLTNESRVKREIAKAINNSPLRFANACSWEAVLTVPSRLNEMSESFEKLIA